MDAGEKKNRDLYAVLGLNKDCSAAELRNAYKKLAMRWHPDRFSASGNLKHVEDAKRKFQSIQEAYSVLSDDNKRFLYDVDVYDGDDDEDEMGDFLNEMADMISQSKCNENRNESFKDLQDLFVEMFQTDIEAFGSSSHSTIYSSSSSSYSSSNDSLNNKHKHNLAEMNSGKSHGNSSAFNAYMEEFCLGIGGETSSGRTGKEETGEIQEGIRSRRFNCNIPRF